MAEPPDFLWPTFEILCEPVVSGNLIKQRVGPQQLRTGLGHAHPFRGQRIGQPAVHQWVLK